MKKSNRENEPPPVCFTTRLPDDLYRRLRESAFLHFKDISEVVREAISEWLVNHPTKGRKK